MILVDISHLSKSKQGFIGGVAGTFLIVLGIIVLTTLASFFPDGPMSDDLKCVTTRSGYYACEGK